jgi:hypothetical protein
MSEKCTYATVGISEDREEPVIVTGKRNVSFEIGGEEFDRTATLRLPERMTASEFNQWKSESGIDLIDIYFHCIKQTPRKPKPAPEDAGGEVGEEEQSELVTDGGEPEVPGEALLPEEEIEHRCSEARKQLDILREKADRHFPTSAGFLAGVIEDIDAAEEMVKKEKPVNPSEPVTDGGEEVCPLCGEEGERLPDLGEYLRACMNLECRVNEFEVNRTATDGGSSMPKMALEHLKELDATDEKIGEWLSEKVGEPIGGMTDLYASEHSIPDAMNEVELGEGFSLKEPEYIELLTLLDSGREAAANDPPTLGVRNRLLMQLILANPEAYARIRQDMEERAKEAHEEMQQEMNRERERQRMTERASDLNGEGVDISLNDEEENDGGE